MNVLLLAGGISNEREVSLRSGQAVKQAIEELGHVCVVADPADESFDISQLSRSIDVVFLALHGKGGEDGVIQEELERLNIPFVGSGSESSALCFDKWRYKQFLNSRGVLVAEGIMVSAADVTKAEFQRPYVLKPVDGGSSLDTQIVREVTEATKNRSLELLSTYPTMLLEPLISGTEITVGVLGDVALPVIEVIPPTGGEFDYENKYNGATQELCPPKHVALALQQQAQQLAQNIHTLCGCKHMSRTDIIIDAHDQLFVLETNTIPGLTTQSLLPKMAQEAGLLMADLVGKLLTAATKK